MGKFVRALCWVLTGWFFAYNLYAWGGLAITPTIGKQLLGGHHGLAVNGDGIGRIGFEIRGGERTSSLS